MNFDNIIDDFQFLDNWEDKYKYIIDMGNSLSTLKSIDYNDDNKVEGCASQVWMHSTVEKDIFYFEGDSDAIIVRGLISLLKSLYSGLPVSEVGNINAVTELNRLGLTEHLSSQRSNGLNAMVNKIKKTAEDELSKR